MRVAILIILLMFAVAWPARGNQPDPISHETATRQARPRVAGERFDLQESDPRLRNVFSQTDLKAERAVANIPRDKQFIFRFWSIKKALLRRDYAIQWKTPAELNPNIAYESYGQPAVTVREIREITPIVRSKIQRRGEKIASFERTFDGRIHVWTKVGDTEELGRYVAVRFNGKWKIVDRHVVVP